MTAVEWLYKFLYEMKSVEGFDPYNFNQKDVFNKAKEMHKQEIIDAWNIGYREFYDGSSTPEEYYNKTFKSE